MERPFILLLDKSFEFNVQKKVCVHTLLSVGSVYPLLLQEQEVDAQKAVNQNERRSRNNGLDDQRFMGHLSIHGRILGPTRVTH